MNQKRLGRIGQTTTRLLAAALLAGLTAGPARAATLTVTDNLLVQLSADSGVTTDMSNQVTSWTDQAALGGANDATNGSSTGPTLETNGIGGLPTLNFNGSNQYLQIGAISALNNLDQLSWFLVTDPTTIGGTQIILRSSYAGGAGAGSTTAWGTFIQSSGYKTYARAASGTFEGTFVGSSATPAIVSGVWASDNSVTGQVNGVSNTVSGADAVPTTHNYTRIGANTTGLDTFYSGDVSEVLVYSAALNESQTANVQSYLKAKYNMIDRTALNSGVVLYSSMDDNAVDRNGTNPPPALSTDDGNWTVQNLAGPHNGTAQSVNTGGSVTSSNPGQIGQAATFSTTTGGNRQINYGDNFDITASTSRTISFWFNSAVSNGTYFILGKGNAGSGNVGFSIDLVTDNGGELIARAQYNGGTLANRLSVSRPFGAADANTWHQITLVIDNTTGLLTAYFDGLGSGTTGTDNGWSVGGGGGQTNVFTPGQDFSNADDLKLGIRTDDMNEWPGSIDDLAMWDRALSAQDIADIYQLGLNGQSFFVPTPAALPAGLIGLAALLSPRRRRHRRRAA